jgi:fatty acid desaturase
MKRDTKPGLRQRLVSLISAAVFLGFLWALFNKMNIVTWIIVPWWAFILLLIVFFFVIETFVARAFGAKEPVQRAVDSAAGSAKTVGHAAAAAGEESLDAVKKRIDEFNAKRLRG